MTNQQRAIKILGIMARKKVTKAELARRTGLHENTIRNLVDGKHTVKYEPTLQVVETVLGVKAKSLL